MPKGIREILESPKLFFLSNRKRVEKMHHMKVPLSKYKIFLQEILDKRLRNTFINSVRTRKTSFLQEMIAEIERMEEKEKVC